MNGDRVVMCAGDVVVGRVTRETRKGQVTLTLDVLPLSGVLYVRPSAFCIYRCGRDGCGYRVEWFPVAEVAIARCACGADAEGYALNIPGPREHRRPMCHRCAEHHSGSPDPFGHAQAHTEGGAA